MSARAAAAQAMKQLADARCEKCGGRLFARVTGKTVTIGPRLREPVLEKIEDPCSCNRESRAP